MYINKIDNQNLVYPQRMFISFFLFFFAVSSFTSLKANAFTICENLMENIIHFLQIKKIKGEKAKRVGKILFDTLQRTYFEVSYMQMSKQK